MKFARKTCANAKKRLISQEEICIVIIIIIIIKGSIMILLVMYACLVSICSLCNIIRLLSCLVAYSYMQHLASKQKINS